MTRRRQLAVTTWTVVYEQTGKNFVTGEVAFVESGILEILRSDVPDEARDLARIHAHRLGGLHGWNVVQRGRGSWRIGDPDEGFIWVRVVERVEEREYE